MGYFSTLGRNAEDDDNQIPASLHSNKEEGLFTGRVQIGWDQEEHAVYSAVVVLAPAIPGRLGEFELFFDVVKAFGKAEVEEFRDGRSTKSFLQGRDRSDVLCVICDLARELISLAKPETLHYMTLDTDLPPKALVKYEILCKAIREIGYRGAQVDAYLGTNMWQFEKIEL